VDERNKSRVILNKLLRTIKSGRNVHCICNRAHKNGWVYINSYRSFLQRLHGTVLSRNLQS